MDGAVKAMTSELNGRLWGSHAEDWAAIQEGQVRPAYAAVLARIGAGPGMKLLDAGCGAGMAASMAAELGAGVAGLDASEALLAIARRRLPEGDFRQGDLVELPFADAIFDAVTGFNAFQFAGDPAGALREARRVVKPGGRVAVLTWGTPEGMEAASLVGALRPLMPPPPPGAPGPFALSDEGALRDFAAEAGLAPGEVFDVDCAFSYPDEATALRGLGSSGAAERARQVAGADALDAAHAAALAPFRQADGGYRIRAVFRALIAVPA